MKKKTKRTGVGHLEWGTHWSVCVSVSLCLGQYVSRSVCVSVSLCLGQSVSLSVGVWVSLCPCQSVSRSVWTLQEINELTTGLEFGLPTVPPPTYPQILPTSPYTGFPYWSADWLL
ncbi:hypothetical protein ElyMa_005473700 [Elysia marginata]|uniref:Uncharacterized protein n=1 Tax=Elysia marginata TaxID=1093978 RepID=A0AAV4EPT6_9GAST|nr:hypothetical protein ElyMa_005473700 [Elysia marginata]